MDRRTQTGCATAAALAGLADFPSVRGDFRLGKDHVPVQHPRLSKVAKRPDGNDATETVRKVVSADVDAYAADCRMPS